MIRSNQYVVIRSKVIRDEVLGTIMIDDGKGHPVEVSTTIVNSIEEQEITNGMPVESKLSHRQDDIGVVKCLNLESGLAWVSWTKGGWGTERINQLRPAIMNPIDPPIPPTPDA